jgi:hypothetical protein
MNHSLSAAAFGDSGSTINQTPASVFITFLGDHT